jgi:hypothetical protein
LHVATAAVHALALHVHAADPALPVQLWFTPGHAAGVPYAQHPLLPIVHVARPELHSVSPCEQLLVHVSEHTALGDSPEHDSVPGHIIVEATYGQLSLSTMHVASVCPSWQVVPATEQADETHAHAEALPAPVHVWCAPQVVDVHCVHPDCVVQVCTEPPPVAHCTRPSVHAFVQGPPSPLASAPVSVTVASIGPASAPVSMTEASGPLFPASVPPSAGGPPANNPASPPASRLWPGTNVGSVLVAITLVPHVPVPGWQLSPLIGHVDSGSPSAPVTRTCPLHTSASTKYSVATRSVGAWSCASRRTIGVPIKYAVTRTSTSWSALLPVSMNTVVGSVASDGTSLLTSSHGCH